MLKTRCGGPLEIALGQVGSVVVHDTTDTDVRSPQRSPVPSNYSSDDDGDGYCEGNSSQDRSTVLLSFCSSWGWCARALASVSSSVSLDVSLFDQRCERLWSILPSETNRDRMALAVRVALCGDNASDLVIDVGEAQPSVPSFCNCVLLLLKHATTVWSGWGVLLGTAAVASFSVSACCKLLALRFVVKFVALKVWQLVRRMHRWKHSQQLLTYLRVLIAVQLARYQLAELRHGATLARGDLEKRNYVAEKIVANATAAADTFAWISGASEVPQDASEYDAGERCLSAGLSGAAKFLHEKLRVDHFLACNAMRCVSCSSSSCATDLLAAITELVKTSVERRRLTTMLEQRSLEELTSAAFMIPRFVELESKLKQIHVTSTSELSVARTIAVSLIDEIRALLTDVISDTFDATFVAYKLSCLRDLWSLSIRRSSEQQQPSVVAAFEDGPEDEQCGEPFAERPSEVKGFEATEQGHDAPLYVCKPKVVRDYSGAAAECTAARIQLPRVTPTSAKLISITIMHDEDEGVLPE